MKKINKLQTNKDLARVCRILLLLFLLPRYTTGALAQPFLSRVGNESVRQGGFFFLLASEQVWPHVTSADDEASQWPRTGRRRGPALDSEWK